MHRRLFTLGIALALVLVTVLVLAVPALADSTCALTVEAPNGCLVEVFKGSTRITHGTMSGTSKLFNLDPDTYKVRIKQESVYTSFEPVDCTGATQTLDALETLTVNAPQGCLVEVFAGSSRAIHGTIGSSESIILNVVPRNDYSVRIKQESVYNSFAADASSGPATVDAMATLTVSAPNGSLVEVFKGSSRATHGTVSGTSIALKVVKCATYRVRVKQESVYTNFEPVDCSSGTGSLNALTTLTVNAPKGCLVEVFAGSSRAIHGTIGSSESIILNVVPRSDYSVRIKQESVYNSFAADASSGPATVDAMATLTVSAPNGSLVEVFKGSSRATHSTVSGTSITLKVVKCATYRVRVKQESVYTSFEPVDCSSGAGAIDVLRQLTVTAPQGCLLEVYVGSSRATHGTVPAGKSLTLDIVQRDDYKVRVKQGSVYTYFEPVDCTSNQSLDALCQIQVTAPSGALVEVYVGSSRATHGTVPSAGTLTLDVVKRDGYTVRIKYSGKYYYYHNVDAKSTCPAVLDKSTLTVKFPGIKMNRVLIKNQAGTTVAWNDWRTDQTSFDLDYGLYDIVLTQGKAVKVVEDVYVLGQVTVENLVCTLTVAHDGITPNRVRVLTGAGEVTKADWSPNSTVLKVLRGTYDVTVQQGAALITKSSVDCNSATANVENIVCTLTVEHPGITPNRVRVLSGGGEVAKADWSPNSTILKVLRGTYDVTVQQGAALITVTGVDCNSATATVTDVVCTLTVEHPGITPNRVRVLSGGSEVTKKDWSPDATVMTVLRGTYDVTVQQGAALITVNSVDCTCASGPGLVKDIVCVLTVKHPGIKPNRVKVLTQTGGEVTKKDWSPDETVMTVLRGTYDIVLQHGAKIKTVEDVDCSGSTATVDKIVCVLTIKFPGFKASRIRILTLDGGEVTKKDWQQDQAVFDLLKNKYLVEITIDGQTATVQVNCKGNKATLANAAIKVFAPYGTSVKVYDHGGALVGSVSNVGSDKMHLFSGLTIGLYDVVLKQGACEKTLDDLLVVGTLKVDELCVLTLTAPNGTSAKLKCGANTLTSISNVGTDKKHVFEVIKGNYDLVVKQGGCEATVPMNCTGETLRVDQLFNLTVYAPNGTAAKMMCGANTLTSVSNVGTDKKHVFEVIKGTWTLYLKQGAGERTVPGVDCTAENGSRDELFRLTVFAPNGTAAKLLVPGTSNVVTSVSNVGTDKKHVFEVIKGTWDLFVQQGAGTNTVPNVACTAETGKQDQLCRLTVYAPNGTAAKLLVPGTSNVVTSVSNVGTDKKHVFDVIKGKWDLLLKQGAGSKTVPNVDCTGETQVCKQKVRWTVYAPNGTAVKVYTADRSGVVTSVSNVGTDRRHTFDVVPDTYDLYLKQGAGEVWMDDIVVTANKTTDQLFQLKVYAPNGTAASLKSGGAVVTSTSNVGTDKRHTFDVIKGTWDLCLKQGAGQADMAGIDCATGETKNIDQLFQLTVKAPNGASASLKSGGGVVTSVSNVGTDKKHVFDVIKGTWDLCVKQGAGQVTVGSVDCASTETKSIDQLCQLTVKAPNGTAVKVYVSGTTSVVTSVSNVGTDGKHVFDVIKDTWDVFALGATKSADCTGETQSVTFP